MVVRSDWLPPETVLLMDETHLWPPRAIATTLHLDFADGSDFTAWVARGLGDRVKWLGGPYTHVIRPPQQIGRRAWASDWWHHGERRGWWEE